MLLVKLILVFLWFLHIGWKYMVFYLFDYGKYKVVNVDESNWCLFNWTNQPQRGMKIDPVRLAVFYFYWILVPCSSSNPHLIYIRDSIKHMYMVFMLPYDTGNFANVPCDTVDFCKCTMLPYDTWALYIHVLLPYDTPDCVHVLLNHLVS